MLSTVFTNDVRHTLDQFRRSVDEMFENFYGQGATLQPSASAGERTSWRFSPLVESGWSENHLNLRAILPGVSDKDVHVTVQNNQLIIEGERKAPEGFERNSWTQIAYGKFYAAVTLPAGLDVDRVNCRLQDGVLDIRVPIAEASKPRQIQIETGGSQKSLS